MASKKRCFTEESGFARIHDVVHDLTETLPTFHDATRREYVTQCGHMWTQVASELSTKATELSAKAQATATELSAKAQATATELSAKAHELSDSIFQHMLGTDSATQARRRALMLVDVLVAALLALNKHAHKPRCSKQRSKNNEEFAAKLCFSGVVS